MKLIRSNILKREKWEFTVDIKGFMILQEFKSFLHWIITGLKSILDIYYSKKKEIEKFVDIAGQIIINSVKTRMQVNYITKNFDKKRKEITFTLGLALHIHKVTREK